MIFVFITYMGSGQSSGMDRSAVIRSMDRERLRKVSDPYPLEFFLANHKRLAVMLHQCDLQGFLGTLQLQVQAQTHTHTHHTARMDLAKRWLRHCHYIHHIQLVAACPATTTGASGPILKVMDTLVLTRGPPDANDLGSAPQACNS